MKMTLPDEKISFEIRFSGLAWERGSFRSSEVSNSGLFWAEETHAIHVHIGPTTTNNTSRCVS
jgi:hypothetical protein